MQISNMFYIFSPEFRMQCIITIKIYHLLLTELLIPKQTYTQIFIYIYVYVCVCLYQWNFNVDRGAFQMDYFLQFTTKIWMKSLVRLTCYMFHSTLSPLFDHTKNIASKSFSFSSFQLHASSVISSLEAPNMNRFSGIWVIMIVRGKWCLPYVNVVKCKSQLQIKILTLSVNLLHPAAIYSQTLNFPSDQYVTLHSLKDS
jgi:hypothetical protein